MDSKFYVSYETARLLKEKGYRDKTMHGYNSKDQIKNTLDVRKDHDWNNPEHKVYSTETGEYVEMFAAPTKSEAIDWLESKGHRINIIYDWIECKWYFTIINGSPTVKNITELEVSDSVFYSTRLEAEEAAIIKACEQL